MQDAERPTAGERRSAGQHRVHGAAQRVQVGSPVDRAAVDLLRCHVVRAAPRGSRPGQVRVRRRIQQPSDTEVADLHHAARGHDQIGRLDVPVNDPGRMRGGQPVADLRPHRKNVGDRQRPVGQQRRHRRTLHQLHHQVRLPVLRSDVVHRHHVGVRQPTHRPGLTVEAFQRHRLAQPLTGQLLDRDRPVQSQVTATPRRWPCRRRRATARSGSDHRPAGAPRHPPAQSYPRLRAPRQRRQPSPRRTAAAAGVRRIARTAIRALPAIGNRGLTEPCPHARTGRPRTPVLYGANELLPRPNRVKPRPRRKPSRTPRFDATCRPAPTANPGRRRHALTGLRPTDSVA